MYIWSLPAIACTRDVSGLPVAVTRALLSEGLESLLAQERDHQAALFLTEDHAEGKAAFKARRAPVFHGR